MSDEPAKKRDWAVPFLGRLCLIAWVCMILYEAFDFLKPIRQICLLFGPWACLIALFNALTLLFIRRQGIFFIFLLISIPPTIHFGLVLKNIAIEKKWLEPSAVRENVPEELKQEEMILEQTTPR
jgi:hypothetical protein